MMLPFPTLCIFDVTLMKYSPILRMYTRERVRNTYNAVALPTLWNMTRYCGGYGFMVTGLGDEGCWVASAKWLLNEPRKERASVAEGMVFSVKSTVWELLYWCRC